MQRQWCNQPIHPKLISLYSEFESYPFSYTVSCRVGFPGQPFRYSVYEATSGFLVVIPKYKKWAEQNNVEIKGAFDLSELAEGTIGGTSVWKWNGLFPRVSAEEPFFFSCTLFRIWLVWLDS